MKFLAIKKKNINIYGKMTEEEKTKLKLNNDQDYKRYLRLMKDTKHKY